MTSAAPSPPALGSMAWPARIAGPFLERLTERLGLHERTPASAARYVMRSPADAAQVGQVRVLDGEGLQAVVESTAHTSTLEMWQVVAFAPPESAVPHLSFDAKANPGGCWFSVDLVPRASCTEDHAWATYVYEPLSDQVWRTHEREDMRQALIRARHRMHLSPWLVTMRLDDEAGIEHAIETVLAFTDRFCDLVLEGIPDAALPALTPQQLAARDANERSHLYSWDATANYRYLAMLAGDEAVDVVQATLQNGSLTLPD